MVIGPAGQWKLGPGTRLAGAVYGRFVSGELAHIVFFEVFAGVEGLLGRLGLGSATATRLSDHGEGQREQGGESERLGEGLH